MALTIPLDVELDTLYGELEILLKSKSPKDNARQADGPSKGKHNRKVMAYAETQSVQERPQGSWRGGNPTTFQMLHRQSGRDVEVLYRKLWSALFRKKVLMQQDNATPLERPRISSKNPRGNRRTAAIPSI